MHQWRWRYGALVLIFLWMLVTYWVISPLRSGTESDYLQFRLQNLTNQIEFLKRTISQMKNKSTLKKIYLQHNDNKVMSSRADSLEEYENLRHRIRFQGKELWYFLESQLTKAINRDNIENIEKILEQTKERKTSWLSDMSRLTDVDRHAAWRRAEAASVSDLVQRRLRAMQNPPDCKAANKLICKINKGCGFGCQLHHLLYCFIFAYATERTVILSSEGWSYSPGGWEKIFEPISESCFSIYEDKIDFLPASQKDKVISVGIIDTLSDDLKPKFLPLSIPKDLAYQILKFNGDPASWWIGQIVKFVFKPNNHLQKQINETFDRLGFKGPIVGVHIRRTDKVGTEAAFHHVKEYMKHVDDYFDELELSRSIDKRRVYIASDDPAVLDEARKLYPNYEILGDISISRSAAVDTRYSLQSLIGVVIDIHLLAACDYLVCTFSSQVGRVAYEMMQARMVDASDSVHSLDDIYYYGGQNKHDRVAVLNHSAQREEEISFVIGDIIVVAGNHWNGYGKGCNERTNTIGLFPYFKTVDKIVLEQFPEYKNVPLQADKER